MADERLRSKSELKRLFTNLLKKKITDEMMSVAIDSLWRDKNNKRSSGFEFPAHFDSEFSFDTGTRIFSIKPWDPLVTGFNPRYGIYSWTNEAVFHRIFDALEIVIPDEEGLFCVYFDTEPDPGKNQVLYYKKNPTAAELQAIYTSKVLVSCFYWDAQNSEVLHFGEDRHGSEWNPQIHWYLHTVFGAKRKSGLQFTGYSLNGDGSSNAHAQFSITSGVMLHDDIELAIQASSTSIPVLYSLGTYPRFLTNNGYAFAGAARAYFNSGQNSLALADTGNFVSYHIFATNEKLTESRKIISVMGIAQYTTLADALKGIDPELDSIVTYMPQQGRCYLGTIILQTSDDFTNDTHTIIVALSANKTHLPVTIHPDSSQYLEIDENQVLKMLGGGSGQDGITPHIGINGNWYIGETDTGVQAQGQDGEAGAPGADGADGADGNTPYIQGGYWYIDGISTGILAQGENGEPGTPGATGLDAGGSFEFCVVGGIAQIETLDLYASSSFTITKLVAESDGTLTSVTVKIGATAVTGLNAVSVGTLTVFNATALNAVTLGDRITIEIGTGYSGTPTIIRGKLICTP